MRFARDSAGYWVALVALGALLFAGFEFVDAMQEAMRTEIGRFLVGAPFYWFVMWLIDGRIARDD